MRNFSYDILDWFGLQFKIGNDNEFNTIPSK